MNKRMYDEIKPYFYASNDEISNALQNHHQNNNCKLTNLDKCPFLRDTFKAIKSSYFKRKGLIFECSYNASPVLCMKRTIAIRMTNDDEIDCLEYEEALRTYLSQKKNISEDEMLKELRKASSNNVRWSFRVGNNSYRNYDVDHVEINF